MDLFDHPGQMSEPVAPEEERRLIRKIDLMILPYLSICYAFFYIDKTTLSYAGEHRHLPLSCGFRGCPRRRGGPFS